MRAPRYHVHPHSDLLKLWGYLARIETSSILGDDGPKSALQGNVDNFTIEFEGVTLLPPDFGRAIRRRRLNRGENQKKQENSA